MGPGGRLPEPTVQSGGRHSARCGAGVNVHGPKNSTWHARCLLNENKMKDEARPPRAVCGRWPRQETPLLSLGHSPFSGPAHSSSGSFGCWPPMTHTCPFPGACPGPGAPSSGATRSSSQPPGAAHSPSLSDMGVLEAGPLASSWNRPSDAFTPQRFPWDRAGATPS